MRRIMKSVVAMVAIATAAFAFAQEAGEAKGMSLADARASIGEALNSPAELTATMKSLSPADQAEFVRAVNAAIDSMPGSNEEKAAVAINANKALLKGATGNVVNVLAAIYASAPMESLALLSESFAQDLFNRDADPSRPYTDEQFAAIAEAVVKKISEAASATDDGAVRSSFGVVMMVKASNGSPADLADTLAATLPEDIREVAAQSAKSDSGNYRDLYAYSSENVVEPNTAVALRLAGPQILDALRMDVPNNLIRDATLHTPILDQVFGGFGENVVLRTDGNDTYMGADSSETLNKQPDPTVDWNPNTYRWGK